MLEVTLVLTLVFVTLWFLWRKKKLSIFKSLNIPGPEPSLFFGNYWEILHEGQAKCVEKWIKQHGRVFGYYYGLRPVLIVADPDLLKTIQQKQFHQFSYRPPLFEAGSSTTSFNRHSITTANGKKWKDLRSVLTPTFTTSKLKSMSPILNASVDELVEIVDKEAAKGKPFNIYRLFQNLTMDVIARTALGVYSKAQTDKNEPFVKLARILFSFEMSYLTMFTFSFPEFMTVFSAIRRISLSSYNKGKHPREDLDERTKLVIEDRRKNPSSRRRDLLQLMMDAQRTQENVNDSSLTAGENDDQIANAPVKQGGEGRKLSNEEVLQNAVVFLLAGYETTSTALAFITHLLSYHQDIQDKLREDIRNNLEEDKELTYETVQKCQYLEQVINESLRIYPPITNFVNRQPVDDTEIEGVKIPKNVAIQVPVYNLHHDPEFWDNPEEFNPERFSPDEKANHTPMVFQPFGAGPRNCIGMRFALWEIKRALVKLLTKYKIKPVEGTKKEDLDISYTLAIMRPRKGIVIEVELL